ncbi:MAG: hypothetical protein E7620_03780 [Ruminococcaceae bacterium]|nr:hypothetical protein [Oscillospiraceae bacterium]
MKKIISVFLLASMLFSTAALTSCASRRAPDLEKIYDRVVELIEASYEINSIFYGEGLPYCDRELPIYKELYSDYTKLGYTKNYNIVSSQSKYKTIGAIKLAAEAVYSTELLEKSVYPSAFEGVIVPDVHTGVHSSDARYLESNDDLYILIPSEKDHHPTPLIYDYSTMKIVRPSNSTRVLISITAWEVDRPELPIQTRLSLILQNGVWMLDSLTV